MRRRSNLATGGPRTDNGRFSRGSLLSGYFDRRSELFHRAFGDALPYREYLATGNSREAAAWARADAALPALPDDAGTHLDPAGRIVNVLCLSGVWCGDCVRSAPIVARLAEAAGPPVDLRFVDRDAIPDFGTTSAFWEPCGFPWCSS